MKPLIWISTICVISTALLCFWLMYPNAELRASHQATLCNVLRFKPELSEKNEILEQMQFSYKNSTPSYAYHHPKFYQGYSKHLVKQFLNLNHANQVQAKNNYETCRELLR